MPFPDGGFPDESTIKKWLNLCKEHCDMEHPIGVHCIAGLGRAPVLVAIALIQKGMPAEDAIELIRKKRKGAINSKQLNQLNKFKKGDCVIA